MVPTPRALELRDEVSALLRGCDNVLRPGAGFDAVHLQRTFTVQATDLLLTGLAGTLSDRIHAEAPHVDVVFLPEAFEADRPCGRGWWTWNWASSETWIRRSAPNTSPR